MQKNTKNYKEQITNIAKTQINEIGPYMKTIGICFNAIVLKYQKKK